MNLMSRKIRKQKVAGTKSREVAQYFARQLVPATFCSRDFLFQYGSRYEKVPQGYLSLPLFFIVRTAWSLVFDTYVPCVSILEVTFHFTELYQFSCLYTKVPGERCFEMIYQFYNYDNYHFSYDTRIKFEYWMVYGKWPFKLSHVEDGFPFGPANGEFRRLN